jgi:hypothetical protein
MIGISFFLLNNVFGYIGNLRNWHALAGGCHAGAALHGRLAGGIRLAGVQALADG